MIKKFLRKFAPVEVFIVFFVLLFFSSIITSSIQTELLEKCNSPINEFELKYCGNMTPFFQKGQRDFRVYDLTLQPFTMIQPIIYEKLNVVDDIYYEYYNELAPVGHYLSPVVFPWFRIEIDTFTLFEAKHSLAFLGKFIMFSLHIFWWAIVSLFLSALWTYKKGAWGKWIAALFIIDKLAINTLAFHLLGIIRVLIEQG